MRRSSDGRLTEAVASRPVELTIVLRGLDHLTILAREVPLPENAQGWLGPWVLDHGVQVVFAVPGIVLATVFGAGTAAVSLSCKNTTRVDCIMIFG